MIILSNLCPCPSTLLLTSLFATFMSFALFCDPLSWPGPFTYVIMGLELERGGLTSGNKAEGSDRPYPRIHPYQQLRRKGVELHKSLLHLRQTVTVERPSLMQAPSRQL